MLVSPIAYTSAYLRAARVHFSGRPFVFFAANSPQSLRLQKHACCIRGRSWHLSESCLACALTDTRKEAKDPLGIGVLGYAMPREGTQLQWTVRSFVVDAALANPYAGYSSYNHQRGASS